MSAGSPSGAPASTQATRVSMSSCFQTPVVLDVLDADADVEMVGRHEPPGHLLADPAGIAAHIPVRYERHRRDRGLAMADLAVLLHDRSDVAREGDLRFVPVCRLRRQRTGKQQGRAQHSQQQRSAGKPGDGHVFLLSGIVTRGRSGASVPHSMSIRPVLSRTSDSPRTAGPGRSFCPMEILRWNRSPAQSSRACSPRAARSRWPYVLRRG